MLLSDDYDWSSRRTPHIAHGRHARQPDVRFRFSGISLAAQFVFPGDLSSQIPV